MNSILLKLKQNNIRLSLRDDDNLEIVSYDKKIPADLLQEIREHKASLIDHLKAFRDTDAFQPIPAFAAMESYPLAHPQKRLWVVSQMAEASAAYNMFSHVFLDGTYEEPVFRKAVQALIQRHETLRTVFRQDELGAVSQWVINATSLPNALQFRDLSALSDPHSAVQAQIRDDQYLPHDLENGPLFRIILFKLQDQAYCFYVNIHHIVSDGWSMDVLSRDLVALYDGLSADPDFSLPALRIQYKDFTLWQLSRYTPAEIEAHRAYWLSELSGVLPLIDLPVTQARPAYKTYNGRTLATCFDPAMVQLLKTYCESHAMSLYTGILSLLFVVFKKYTQSADLVIGTALAGREHADLHDQIGFYINTLAIRDRSGAGDSFDDICTRVKDTLFKGMQHQDYTLDMILPDLELTQNGGRNPVFDVMFTFQNLAARNGKNNTPEYTGAITALEDCVAKFDIDMTMGELGDTLELVLKYNADVYDEAIMMAFIRHLQEGLKVCMEHTAAPIAAMDMYTAEDETLTGNSPEHIAFAYPQAGSVVTLFRQAAQQFPGATALVCNDRVFTYAELDLLTDKLAGYLHREYQLSPGDFAGIQLDRNEHFVIAFLGILKCGAVYVPIDPELPEASKAYIAADAGLKLLVTETAYIFDVSYCEAPIFAIDVEFEPGDDNDCPEVSFDARDLIYIIYTSGTTGKPKGVMVEHRGVINLITYQAAYFGVQPDDRFVVFSNFAFDASVEQIYLALLHGAALHIVSKLDILDLDRFTAFLKDKKITHLHAVPSFLRELPYFEDSSLKRIVSGGDSFDNQIFQVWQQHPGVRIINEYGPTETTVTAVQRIVDGIVKGNCIGKPLGNTYCYILNEQLCRQLPGVTGELYIGGDGVARGYLNKPDLTAAAFLDNPFRPGEQFYKTGDLARYLPDGAIEFIGRSDTQIKVNGYRIELSNIEYYLEQHPGVAQVVVLLKQQEAGGQELWACVVAAGNEEPEDLRAYLVQRLPAYMIPHRFVLFDKFPLTPIGKIDRKALQALEGTEVAKDEFIPVKTDKERILAEVFKEVLKHEQISVRDNFYKLGGDSIKSIQVVSRLKQKGYNLKVEQVLRTPLIEDLAKLMDENYREIDQSSISGPVVLTPIQRYFFANEHIREPRHYNQSVVLKSKEAIHPETLRRSLVTLVKHHDALRMTFTQDASGWQQYNQYTQGDHFEIHFHDLTDAADPVSQMEVLGGMVQAGFNLETGPLFKVIHFRLADGDRLCLVAHHLVVDGVSWRILLEDLATLYSNYKVNTLPSLPLKTNAYQHWAAGLEAYVAAGRLGAEMAYWQRIAAVATAEIPSKATEPGYAVRFNSEQGFSLDALQTAAIFKLHKVYNTEINDVLLTAFAWALKTTFGISRSALLLEGHGREEIQDDMDISRTVGWFTTIYPFVMDIASAGDDRFDALVQVKEALRAIPHKGIGYGMLKYFKEDFPPVAEPRIAFNYLGDFGGQVTSAAHEVTFEFSGESIGANSSPRNSQEITLDISGMIVSGQLSMSLRFDDQVHEAGVMTLLANEYHDALQQLIAGLQEKQDERYITSSDLTYKALSREELDLLNERYQLEDIYELSPLQSGIYYHWLANRSASAYFEQMAYRLHAGNLDLALVKQAYDQLVSRYAILRTSFSNEYGGLPLQIVHKSVPSSFSTERVAAADMEAAIEAIKEQDKAQGFDLELQSQMRLKVLELGEGRYEFVWSNHHILMDGWCISILINEFYSILMGLMHQQPVSLPEPLKYADYIKWLSRLDKAAALTYWEQYLAGVETVAEVPFRVKREQPAGMPFRKAAAIISGDAFTAMQQRCHKLGITPNIFVQAAWGYLLSRYSNVQDVVFGAVVSGRPGELPGVENMIGLFINTIPVRVRYSAADTPADLLQRLQAEALESAPHHYMNLSEVQSLSAPGAELIRTLMVFENYAVQEAVAADYGPAATDSAQAITIEDIDVFEQTNYDFNVIAAPGATQLKVEFKYNPAVFDAALVDQLAGHFSAVVDSFLTAQDTPLSEIVYLSEAEQQQLLYTFNDTSLPYPEAQALPALFEEQVLRTPDHTALVCRDTELSYAALNEAANRLAHYLREVHQLQPDDLVGIKLGRSERMLIAVLAVLKAGGAYVPIDPAYPADRIAYIESDINAKLVIDEDAFALFAESQDSYAVTNPEAVNQAGDLAYIIYTSGTTGQPRGVMVQHNNLVSRISYYSAYYGLSAADTTLFYRSFCFDGAIEEYLVPLFTGARVIIAANNFAESPQENIITAIEQYGITKVNMPPLLLHDLLSEPFRARFTGLVSLKHVVSGGDVLHSRMLKDTTMSATFYNSYGPTENTIDTTNWKVIPDYDSRESVIGSPVYNTQVYILDDQLRLMPVGVTGKIYTAGAGVARGYLNHEMLTREKFLPHPLGGTALMYDTGDLGCWLPDGNIQFSGRKDKQVKIRGFRIELGEIETVMLEGNTVLKQVLVADREHRGSKILVAYYVAGGTVDKKALKAYLQSRLPEYMIPSFYMELERIPLTRNGKTDYKALPGFSGIDLLHKEYIAPVSPEEKALVAVWTEVLKRERIGITDNFYGLGGDSIKSIHITSKLKQAGYSLELKYLLDAMPISELARNMKRTGKAATQFTFRQDWQIGDETEVSANQLRFLKSNYNRIVRSVMVDRFEPEQFETQFRDFLVLFPGLCVRLRQQDNKVLQSYAGAGDVPVVFTQLADYSEQQISETMYAYFKQAFDLYGGELIRVLVFTSGKDNRGPARICIGIHHALADDYTANVLQEQATAFFNGREPAAGYVNGLGFGGWQQQFLASAPGQDLRQYWTDSLLFLEGVPEPARKDASTDARGWSEFMIQEVTLRGEGFASLNALAEQMTIPLSALSLGFYQYLLQHAAPQGRPLAGIMVNGREQQVGDIDTGKLLGVIDNILPLSCDQAGAVLTSETIKACYKHYLEARAAQQVPYEVIREDVKRLYGTDIDSYLAGQFNWLVSDLRPGADTESGLVLSTDSFDWHPGINLVCVLYPDALDITLLVEKSLYLEQEAALSLEVHIETMNQLLNA